MGVTLTPVVFVLRAGPEHEKYGDDYELAATVIVLNGVAEMLGGTDGITIKMAKDIKRAFRKIGVTQGGYERRINGKTRKREYVK